MTSFFISPFIFFFFLTIPITGSHFVLLRTNQTLQNFLAYDTTYPASEQVAHHIQESYRVGDLAIISGQFPQNSLKRLRRCPLVESVTPEITFQAYSVTEQPIAPRHLVSLSSKSGYAPRKKSYFYSEDAAGQDVNVYVIDGGLGRKGAEFAGRIVAAVDFTKGALGAIDAHGHGTHVTGIIGSKTFGVSKEANLIILKVLDSKGQGSLALIISALEFAVNHHRQSDRLGVANLSLGAPYSALINRAVDSVSNAGLAVVVAAGNADKNACLVSPASARLAITVGAIDDRTDEIAEFSNWGPCVDVFASGVDVASVSAWNLKLQKLQKLSRDGLHVYSGTSMAAPIVAGLVANLLSMGVSAADVKRRLLELAIEGRIPEDDFASRPETPNRIVYNGCDPEFESDYEDSSLEN